MPAVDCTSYAAGVVGDVKTQDVAHAAEDRMSGSGLVAFKLLIISIIQACYLGYIKKSPDSSYLIKSFTAVRQSQT